MKGPTALLDQVGSAPQLQKAYVDISELAIPDNVWYTIIHFSSGFDAGMGPNFILDPATSYPAWQMQYSYDSGISEGVVQVMISEPGALVMLIVGGIGVLLRSRMTCQ